VTQPSIKVEGAKELRRAINKAKDQDLKDRLKKANRDAAEIVATQARVEVPKRSGDLAASIRAGGGVTAGVVRAGKKAVPYAGPIHFGWAARNIAPQPFLYRAADKRVGEVAETYLAQVKSIVRDIEKTRSTGGAT
jgi:hypothetical protein